MVTMFRPATNLNDVHKTLSPEPLLTNDELDAFYRGQINDVRGGDQVEPMALNLGWSSGGAFYKAFLYGHSGVGKSTELTRLIRKVADSYRAIRFSVAKELNPGSFKPTDVLLLMMIRLVEQAHQPLEKGGADGMPSEGLLKAILDFFAHETSTRIEDTRTAIEGGAGIGPPASSTLAKVLGLFASVKGEIKYAVDRKREVVEYRLSRISTLIDLLNRLLDECNELLQDRTGCEWLFIGEDFDKAGIPLRLNEELFLNYANIFKDLRSHFVFTLPVGLAYTGKSALLPLPSDCMLCLSDTPVFDPDHKPHRAGRAALSEILEARAVPDLFEGVQMRRLIVASGGNLRDLFSLVGHAARNAILRPSKNGKINASDAYKAIVHLRTEYRDRLGQGPSEEDPINYKDKAERLRAIYNSDKKADIPDPVLHALLRARVVQEFNGERWFGVHPLVVDILASHGIIDAGAGEKIPGGTE